MTSALPESTEFKLKPFPSCELGGGPYNAFLSYIAPIALKKLRACAQRKSRNSHTNGVHSSGNQQQLQACIRKHIKVEQIYLWLSVGMYLLKIRAGRTRDTWIKL